MDEAHIRSVLNARIGHELARGHVQPSPDLSAEFEQVVDRAVYDLTQGKYKGEEDKRLSEAAENLARAIGRLAEIAHPSLRPFDFSIQKPPPVQVGVITWNGVKNTICPLWPICD